MNNRIRQLKKLVYKKKKFLNIVHDNNEDTHSCIGYIKFPDVDNFINVIHYEVYIKNHEDKSIPHFHIRDDIDFDVSIGIFSPEYIGDGKDNNNTDILFTEKECEALDKWLSENDGNYNFSRWQGMRSLWITANDNPFDNESYNTEERYPSVKPDYTKLK
jgi:hypothetical protein